MSDDWEHNRLLVHARLKDIWEKLDRIEGKQENVSVELAVLKTKTQAIAAQWSAIISVTVSVVTAIIVALIKGR